MITKKIKLLILPALLLFSNIASPQWDESQINVFFSIPEIALIDIESVSTNDVRFTVVPSNEPGENANIFESSNDPLWINYSSALSNSNSSRSVTAEISQGELPDGILVYLEASSYTGTGRGNLGHPAEKIELSTQPRPIITGIGNCYTGNGVNNGHLLHFSLEISDYYRINAIGETVFTILYTITDN